MTKINQKYRRGDIQRWQTMDFVLGYTIHLSNNPDKECEVCKYLAGIYPKTFNWSGWHNSCKCFLTPILQDSEDMRENRRNKFHTILNEFDTQELEEMKAILNGTHYEPKEPKGLIKILPKNFLLWYANNVQRMLDLNHFPDFVRDNIHLIKESVEYYQKNR